MFNELSKKAQSSLNYNVDKEVRANFSFIYNTFNETEVDKVLTYIHQVYSEPKLNQPHHQEIKEALLSPDFVQALRERIIDFLNNRPNKERVDHYEELIKKYNLLNKRNINREKLEQRIRKIEKTNGASQDI